MINNNHESVEYVMSFDPILTMLKFTWKDKFIDATTFRKCVSFYATLSQQYHAKRLMVDARKTKFVMTNEVQEWHDTTIVPQYLRAGVKRMAFIIPGNIFSELTHKQTFNRKNAVEKLLTAFFDNENAAVNWLMDC